MEAKLVAPVKSMGCRGSGMQLAGSKAPVGDRGLEGNFIKIHSE
jgi:hypothetical protein